jgi:hypothetical protein
MATLDRVIEMQGQGKADNEIMAGLQAEGISPAEISNALNQAKVKSAISPPAPEQPIAQTPQEQIPQTPPATEFSQEQPAQVQTQTPEGMQPSMMSGQEAQFQDQQYAEQDQQYAEQDQQFYTPQPQAYDEYQGQDYYQPDMYGGSGNFSEIAELLSKTKSQQE